MDRAASQSRARGFRIVATSFIVLVTAGICCGAALPRPTASGAELAGVLSNGPLAVAEGSAVFSDDGGSPGCLQLGKDSPAGTPS